MQSIWHVFANWKMYFSYRETIQWCHDYRQELAALNTRVRIGIAPESSALSSVTSLFAAYQIKVGGQTCSAHAGGAYTGQIHPQSLHDIGCDFCIIGHSEQRAYRGVTSHEVAHQAQELIARGIVPIICVGETQEERERGKTEDIIWKQVHHVMQRITEQHISQIYIAYEPRWAIGSGVTPSHQEIADVADIIRDSLCATHHEQVASILYGGSVSPENSGPLSCIQGIHGFLVGSASCDFQKLKKIVYSVEK